MALEELCGVPGWVWQVLTELLSPKSQFLGPVPKFTMGSVVGQCRGDQHGRSEETMALLSHCLVFHRQANSINSFYQEKNPKPPQKIKY